MQNKVIGIMKIINLFEYVIVFCLAMYSFFYTYSLWDIKRDKTNQQDLLLFIIIFIIYYLIFYVTHICIHELGHLLFGYLCGYEILSIRIGRYNFVKDKKFKAYKINELTSPGQCLMTKKTSEDTLSCILYNIGGCLMNFLTIMVLYFIMNTYIIQSSLVVYYIFFSSGLLVFLTNIIPSIKNGTYSDGLNTYMLAKNRTMRTAYRYQLLFYKQLILNDRPADLFIDRKDSQYLMETINIYSLYPLFMLYYKYLDEKNLVLAEEIIKLLKENANIFSDEAKRRIWLERIYLLCITNQKVMLQPKIEELLKTGNIEYIRIYHALCKRMYPHDHIANQYENAAIKVSPTFMKGLYRFHMDLMLNYEKYIPPVRSH
jgi:hypothetical protein